MKQTEGEAISYGTLAHKDQGSAFLNFTLLEPCVRSTDYLPVTPHFFSCTVLLCNSESSTDTSFSFLCRQRRTQTSPQGLTFVRVATHLSEHGDR